MKNELPHDAPEITDDFRIDRRQFLKTTGTGLFLYFTIGDASVLAQEGSTIQVRRSVPSDFNAFLKIGEDGRVTCYTGKIEMGQGPITSLPQMLADELDVRLDAVDIIMGDTELCPWDMGTFGSLSTRMFGQTLRSAAAEARLVLVELASEELKLPQSQLATEHGEVYSTSNPGLRILYGKLTKGKRIERHFSGKAILKKPNDFKIMGKPELRRDARAKVTGHAKYTADIQLPGMLYAKLLRPPAHGARLLDVDISEAMKVEGVRVLMDGDFVAVVHRHPDIAEMALSRVRAKFDVPPSLLNELNICEHLLRQAPEGKVVSQGGNIVEGKTKASTTVESTFLDSYAAHAPIEPHSAVAKIEGDRATIWASTQTPFSAREEAAKELDLAPENVRVITPFVGGGFGGKTSNQQVVEAARCAKLSGQPAQVSWSRKEEFFYDTFHPAAVIKVHSGTTETGKVTFWDYHVYFAGNRGAEPLYDVPHHNIVAHPSGWVGAPGTHPFATGAWRAPGNNTNTFARESQIDIMASRLGMDPVEFRLLNLPEGRMRRVLQAVTVKFGWKPAKAPSGRGLGVGCGFDAGTYVAAIAEIGVDKKTGDVTVKRVVCAQDMGLVINPEGAKIQMEGCITMGLGYALKEYIRFKGGEILDTNFDTYTVPRFSWLPKIETVILDNVETPPQGGGEPAIILIGAAVGNAIFDAIGLRLFQMPMTPERIQQGLKGH
jgi:nicotinate dehydrogenase subunit B